MTRTSLGLRLRILGANPRAALHAGLNPVRLTVIAFVLSGALIGLSGSVEILGVQGSFRADFNPAYGLLVIPLVFLARLNAIGSLILRDRLLGDPDRRRVGGAPGRDHHRRPPGARRADAAVHGR